MLLKGIFSMLNLKANDEYVGSGISFSKLSHSFKFFDQSFMGRIVYLKSTR